MTKIQVGVPDRGYDILIGTGLLRDAASLIGPVLARAKTVIVTDSHVAPLHGQPLLERLTAQGITTDLIVLPAGEASKSFVQAAQLCEQLLALGVERKDTVIALGGGVIGDLTGFAASILRRGCRFVQIPTTLLAQVDSSVGGKTGINAPQGKNLIGSFYQPSLVLADIDALQTLPGRALRAGYAEVVKYGLINDPTFFAWCQANGAAVLAGDRTALTYAIAHSCTAKAAIVAADERETTGLRALLNLGHTFGHAFEAQAGFSDTLLHGEAVAIGMACAFGFSARSGLCPPEDARQVIEHLTSVGLATTPRAAGLCASPTELIAHMLQDKKMDAGRLSFVLARGIGQCFLSAEVDLSDIEAYLSQLEG